MPRRSLSLVLAAVVVAAAGLGMAAGARHAPGGERSARAAPPPAAVQARGRPPVVMIALDEFPADALLGPDGRIDPVRYPTFASLARTGTWFPNAHSVYDSTPKAIPAILDGKRPRPGVPGTFEGHPRTVFDLFGRRGYRIVSSEEVTAVCPRRWCGNVRRKRSGEVLRLLGRGRRERFERFVRAIRPGRPSFYFKHALLPHGPHLYLPSGKESRRRPEPLPGSESVPGYHDRHVTDFQQQRILLQIGFVDRMIGRMLARMRRSGLLDRALVVITADHGISSEVGVDNRRVVTPANVDEVAPVPLFIKAPGQRRGRAVRSYVRTTDIVPTMADILGFRLPYRADGHSAFSKVVRRRRTVRMFRRDFRGTITVPARVFGRRRAILVRRRLQRFGSGDWASLYTGVGPNRTLLGADPATLGATGAAGVRAVIAGARDMRSVNLRSAVLPTQVAGRVSGGEPRSVRDIAVAVNGRIEGVSRTFYLRGNPRESFAVNVPERSLHAGRNRVQVFEVYDAGRRLRLIGAA